jgi:acid stress chaperone HdeB
MAMNYRMACLIGLLFTAAASPGHAQVTIDIAKITCGQFLAYTIADPKDIALWLSGYYTGKRGGSTLVDAQAFRANYDRLRSHCLVNQDTPVMQAVETVFSDKK